MAEDISLITELRTRIRELEDKVEALRISRRVLMNLIDTLENDKRETLSQLVNKNEKLQKNNCRYAKAIMCQNLKITKLEQELKNLSSST
ncbi:translation initiation factor 2 [Dendrosporobacter sp. 1207_IL3150]|uniref:translation initiation factor 2 n=1 Tax=Dendrosporobacter sp. 1207_IL3150 TaxID=3084054 RepID=UPI002FDA8F92